MDLPFSPHLTLDSAKKMSELILTAINPPSPPPPQKKFSALGFWDTLERKKNHLVIKKDFELVLFLYCKDLIFSLSVLHVLFFLDLVLLFV